MNSAYLKEVCLVFLKLGCIAFGGPAAHIAMMQEELVEKRKWMSQAHFLDMVGATNLIPGPNSTQMTMHCGHVRAGIPGLIVAGLSFILPAVLFTLILAILYGQYGEIPSIAPFFFGIKPAVIGIILNATFKLGKKAFKKWQLWVLGIAIALLAFIGWNEFLLIIGGGLVGMVWLGFKTKNLTMIGFMPVFALVKAAGLGITNASIFWVFLKIALVLFGSGYVLIAYVDAELVTRLGWLTKQELLDAIAIGQFTPGPVLTTATFIGYQLKGVSGALWASVGMFLPSFFLVGFLVKLIPFLRKSVMLSSFLDAVNACAVGVMIAVTFQLGYEISENWQSLVLMGLSIITVLKFPKLSAFWIIIGGGFLGYLLLLM